MRIGWVPGCIEKILRWPLFDHEYFLGDNSAYVCIVLELDTCYQKKNDFPPKLCGLRILYCAHVIANTNSWYDIPHTLNVVQSKQ